MPQLYTKNNGTVRGKKRYCPDPKHFLFNVDTLWYTYDADNYDAVMQEGLMQRLIDGKSISENGEDTDYIQLLLGRYEYPVTFSIESSGQAPIYAF
ncbi:replication initiation protein, partial [Paenibacillus sp. FSL F4-0125]